jgi:Oxidoreductase molybdopterin binding domain
VTPRGTDWSLAALVALGLASGLLTWFGGPWTTAAHDVAGAALALIVVVKVRRVASRLGPTLGLVALAAVAIVLLTGALWATGGPTSLAGYSVLVWHGALGAVLGAGVLAHARVRAKRPRRRDVLDRRQFLTAAGLGLAALAAWRLQRPAQRALGLPGADRRFTGSYDTGDDFPATSWVADHPRPLGAAYRLHVGDRRLTAAELDRGDELVATLDCTGGFYTEQRWRGVFLSRLLAPADGATHVRVISHTGYRWSFSLADAHGLLLATHVGGEPLSHGHGAPCRLVAPGRRGFQWVKWVERIELHDGPDPGAAASTVWSSFTPEGRGRT